MNYALLDVKAVDEYLSLLSKYWGRSRHVEHFNARTLNKAVSLLGEYMGEAKVIAGGVDLISLMKNRVMTPRILVNIKTISDLSYINEDAEGLKIGTLTTIKDIERSRTIRDKYSLLAEAAHLLATPHIRNMGTIGGNLCQAVRCWYYRRSPVTGRSFLCYRKGGHLCYAINGDNRYHAIIGGNKCHSVCPSDMATALIALNARVNIVSPGGTTVTSLEEFYTVGGNILKPDEIITEIQVPTPGSETKQRYLKFRLRKIIDFAIVSAAAVITTEAERVTNARIVLGGVAPIPYRAIAAEEVLKGERITEDAAEMSAKLATCDAAPLNANAYKLPIAKTLVKRAILQ